MSEDQDRVKPAAAHTLGADLTPISADELQRRISDLEAEILRLRAEIARKEAGRRAADSFFSPKV